MVLVAVVWFIVFNLNLVAISNTTSNSWPSDAAPYIVHSVLLILSLVFGLLFMECAHNGWIYMPGRDG